MALFTDGLMSSLADLRSYEHAIVDAAHIEGIDVTEKLQLAQREIGLSITGFLLRRHSELGPHRSLENVIVTSPMTHAHVLHTISLVYRDAYGAQMNDRYAAKWKEYRTLSDQALRTLFEIGIGLVSAPVPKAGIVSTRSASGGGLPARNYYVSVCYENWAGQCGAQSELTVTDVPANQVLTLTVPALPSGVRGYHVRAGEAPEKMWRQTPIALTKAETFRESTIGLREDLTPSEAQMPDYYVMNRRNLLRG